MELPAHYMPEKQNDVHAPAFPCQEDPARAKALLSASVLQQIWHNLVVARGALGLNGISPPLTGCFGPGPLCLSMI